MAHDSPHAVLRRYGTHHWRTPDQRWLVDLKDDGYIVTDTVGLRSFFCAGTLTEVRRRVAIQR